MHPKHPLQREWALFTVGFLPIYQIDPQSVCRQWGQSEIYWWIQGTGNCIWAWVSKIRSENRKELVCLFKHGIEYDSEYQHYSLLQRHHRKYHGCSLSTQSWAFLFLTLCILRKLSSCDSASSTEWNNWRIRGWPGMSSIWNNSTRAARS